MKKTVILFLTILIFSSAAFQDFDKRGLARTYKRQGIEIYILSEPLAEYEVTGKVTNDDAASIVNALSGEEDKRTLTEKIDALISNANRKAKKKKFEFNAIITEDGTTGTCIKFK